jgi:hypothetical protein
MAGQLRHLAVLGQLPNISVRVVPFAAGPHPGLLMTSGFTILDFPEPDGPSIAKNSPAPMSRSTASTALTEPKWRDTCLKETAGVIWENSNVMARGAALAAHKHYPRI